MCFTLNISGFINTTALHSLAISPGSNGIALLEDRGQQLFFQEGFLQRQAASHQGKQLWEMFCPQKSLMIHRYPYLRLKVPTPKIVENRPAPSTVAPVRGLYSGNQIIPLAYSLHFHTFPSFRYLHTRNNQPKVTVADGSRDLLPLIDWSCSWNVCWPTCSNGRMDEVNWWTAEAHDGPWVINRCLVSDVSLPASLLILFGRW